TALGFIVVLADDSEVVYDDVANLAKYQRWIALLLSTVGLQSLFSQASIEAIAHISYFYLESMVRFFIAMSFLDTWQYFLHRLFHNVPYLYKHFHSRHHRLYVTYAFGALYNHPFEGFLMDSVGASLAFLISGMGNRGALAFFSFSTLKTVDDHCGYDLPFNPLQRLFNNNADYHDIHHQTFGIKSNFSQPFGTIWDHILGTHMSREEANQIIKMKEERKAARLAAAAASAVAVGPSHVKSTGSIYSNKAEDVHSSGNNSGNDSHEEESDSNDTKRGSGVLRRTPSAVGIAAESLMAESQIGSSAVEIPGYRERLTTRAR
ncbi:hypothetical protein BGW38_007773, partial [Lunasporangiospora selenospora]